jgi:hypothetical protein
MRRSVYPEPPAGRLSPVRAAPMDFRHGAADSETHGSGALHPRGGAELTDRGRSVMSCADRRLLVSSWSLPVLLLGRGWVSGRRPGERDWMRPSVVRVSANPGDPTDLGNDFLLDAVVNADATTRSDLTCLTASTAVCYCEGSPYMTTDTSTLPRRALVERDDSATPTHRESPFGTDHRRPAARPLRSKRGGRHLLGLLLLDESRQSASDPLLLPGPNGGPLWFSRTQ